MGNGKYLEVNGGRNMVRVVCIQEKGGLCKKMTKITIETTNDKFTTD